MSVFPDNLFGIDVLGIQDRFSAIFALEVRRCSLRSVAFLFSA
jgi:hypothetical protein